MRVAAMDTIERPEALEQGLKFYFTGRPCAKGHIGERLTANRACQLCRVEDQRNKKYWLKPTAKATASQYRKDNPKIGLMCRARDRAKKAGLEFNLTYDDIIIPDLCPILGLKLERNSGGKPSPRSPSLDRIIPALGYIKGNVRVISHRANTIKNDASIEELEAVIRYIKESLSD